MTTALKSIQNYTRAVDIQSDNNVPWRRWWRWRRHIPGRGRQPVGQRDIDPRKHRDRENQRHVNIQWILLQHGTRTARHPAQTAILLPKRRIGTYPGGGGGGGGGGGTPPATGPNPPPGGGGGGGGGRNDPPSPGGGPLIPCGGRMLVIEDGCCCCC